jgi:ligand-binding SRPBCC domain-containing protein
MEREQFIPRPVDEVFGFFADAHNLEKITPDFLHFQIATPGEIVMVPGTLIDFRLRLFGIPFLWQSRIERFEPDRFFSDVQVRGPYRTWHHQHTFEPTAGGTRMLDRFDYELPLGPVGRVAHALWVRSTLVRIFDYRRDRIARLLG